jgi:hypothetical protein
VATRQANPRNAAETASPRRQITGPVGQHVREERPTVYPAPKNTVDVARAEPDVASGSECRTSWVIAATTPRKVHPKLAPIRA